VFTRLSRRWLVAAAGVALLVAGAAAGNRPAAADNATVSINNFAFTPATVTVWLCEVSRISGVTNSTKVPPA